MDATFTITLNGKEVEAFPGKPILDVTRGYCVPIPALCHHKALVPRGSCRLSVLKDSGGRKSGGIHGRLSGGSQGNSRCLRNTAAKIGQGFFARPWYSAATW